MIFIGISFSLLQSRPISSRPHQSYNSPHRLITVSYISLRSWSRSSSQRQDYQSLTLGAGGQIRKRRCKPRRRLSVHSKPRWCCNIETCGDPPQGPRLTYMRTPKTRNRVRCVFDLLRTRTCQNSFYQLLNLASLNDLITDGGPLQLTLDLDDL